MTLPASHPERSKRDPVITATFMCDGPCYQMWFPEAVEGELPEGADLCPLCGKKGRRRV